MPHNFGRFALCVVLIAGSSEAPRAADGQTLFNNACRTCHSTKPGDNRLGPTLAGVVGRKAGTAPGYSFSPSLAQSGITWDKATLDRFIEDPDKMAPGNKMKPYNGLTVAEDRSAIVEHLQNLPD
jgi:cytochrome c